MLLCSVGVKRVLIRIIGWLPAGTVNVFVASKVVMKMKRTKGLQNESRDGRGSREDGDQMAAESIRVFVTRPVVLGGWLECVRQGLPNHTG